MKKIMKICSIALAISTISLSAGPRPTGDSMFYYELGGGEVYYSVPRLDVNVINISFRAKIRRGRCGDFDPRIAISDTLNQMTDALNDIAAQIQGAVSAAIANAPWYALSKINPNLYDTLKSSLAEANLKLEATTKSCELMRAQIDNGKNPYNDLLNISVNDTWSLAAGTNGVSIFDVENQIKEEPGSDGVEHPCHDRAGGKDQPPYNVYRDLSKVGFNRQLGRNKCDSSRVIATPNLHESFSLEAPSQANKETPLTKSFASPEELSDFLDLVIGEVNLTTYDTSEIYTRAGSGLLPLIDKEKNEIHGLFIEMVFGLTTPTIANLDLISDPNLPITSQVIDSLRSISDREASVFISRISAEVATIKMINKALLAQRTLITGVKETEAAKVPTAIEYTEKAIKAIDKEIELALKENRIRKELHGESIPKLLRFAHNKNTTANRDSPSTSKSIKIEDGRIKGDIDNE